MEAADEVDTTENTTEPVAEPTAEAVEASEEKAVDSSGEATGEGMFHFSWLLVYFVYFLGTIFRNKYLKFLKNIYF